MQNKKSLKLIVVDQIVEHARRSSDWKECCADLMKGHDVDTTEIERALEKRKLNAKVRNGMLTFYCVVAYGPTLSGLLMAPGFLLPFMNHPVGHLITIASCLWSMLGICLLWRSTKIWQYVLEVLFFAFPVTLTPMIGPAVVTIVQALGPMYGK